MNFDKTIYTKNQFGKIRFIRIYTEKNLIYQESGLLNGKINKQNPSICKSKNIGKKNETTSEEQAILEAERKYKNKLKRGFYDKIEDIPNNIQILPMLAKDYYKETKNKNLIQKYNLNNNSKIALQPKLDGMRCLIYVEFNNGDYEIKLISRDGKDIIKTSNNTIKHIFNYFNEIIKSNNNLLNFFKKYKIVLDGELYSHDLNFQEIISAIKKYSNNTNKIYYYIYDCFSIIKPFLNFNERYKILKNELNEIFNNENIFKLVETNFVNCEINLDIIIENKLNELISNNYEGLIIRLINKNYIPNSRSNSLLKCKKFKDNVYKIIDIISEEKRPNQGKIRCYCPKTNKEFNCGMKFSHEIRKDFLNKKEKYIGKNAEIRFFEYTNSGIPRYPVCYGIRIDK